MLDVLAVIGAGLLAWLEVWASFVGSLLAITAIFWAIRLVSRQPAPEGDEVGWTDKRIAIAMAAPICLAGLVVLCVIANLSMAP